MLNPMLSKTTAIITSVLVLLCATNSFAFGLGEVKVESTLASPLEANINLNGIERVELDPDQFLIRLKSHLNQPLLYRLKRAGEDSTTIVLFTKRAILTPIFEVQVEVEWDKGKVGRTYSILIDPPEYNEGTETQNVAESSSSSSEQINSTPLATETSSNLQVAEKNIISTETTKGDIDRTDTESTPQFGPTVNGNSLWRVAKIVQTDTETTSIYQWMYGLWKKNTNAFHRQNMHKMKIGQILTIPAAKEISEVSRSSAYQTYSAHLESMTSPASNSSTQSNEGQQQNEATESQNNSALKTAEKTSQNEVAASETEMDAIDPALDDPQIATTETRLALITDSVNNNTDLDEQLETALLETQQILADSGINTIDPVEQAPQPENAIKPVADDSFTGLFETFNLEIVGTFILQKIQKLSQLAPQDTQQLGRLISNKFLWLSAATVCFIVLVIIVLIRNSRRAPATTTRPHFAATTNISKAPETPPPVDNKIEMDASWQTASVVEPVSSSKPESVVDDPASTSEQTYFDEIEAESVIETQELAELPRETISDIIFESDISMAYGESDKAVSLLETTMELQPDETELKFHLLKIYYKLGNAEEFETLLEQFRDKFAEMDDDKKELVASMFSELIPHTDPPETASAESTNLENDGYVESSTLQMTETIESLQQFNDNEPDHSLQDFAETQEIEINIEDTLDFISSDTDDEDSEELNFYFNSKDDGADGEADFLPDQIAGAYSSDNRNSGANITESPSSIDDSTDDNLDKLAELADDSSEDDDAFILDLSEDDNSNQLASDDLDSSIPADQQSRDIDEDPNVEKASTKPTVRVVSSSITEARILSFPDNSVTDDGLSEYEIQVMTTLQVMRDQLQQMNERLFTQERENHQLKLLINELTGDSDSLTKYRKKPS